MDKLIRRPTLLLDKNTCLRNIERMAHTASLNNIKFRPHFKTHQSAVIGDWFRLFGVGSITVSSVKMAEYFALNGWNDITIAFPVNVLEIDNINRLANSIKLNLLVENKEALIILSQEIKFKVGVFIKIDTGYNRSGIAPGKISTIDNFVQLMEDNALLEFKGFLSHTGHTYTANSPYEIHSRHFDALLKMKSLKQKYQKKYPSLIVSMGDTPSCSVCDNFNGVDELRPGNFVFYDLMQYKLGACDIEDIAIKLACPIVAKHASRNEVVIYGGAIHLAKESITNIDGKQMYGRIVISSNGEKVLLDELSYVSSLSQEHGVLKVLQKDLKYFNVGDMVEIIPVHSCLTANLMGSYLSNDGEVIKMIER